MPDTPLINSPLAILITLTSIVAFFFLLEQVTRWKLFTYLPTLVFIYVVPMLLSTCGILANKSPVYDWMKSTVLPFLLVIMLLKVDIVSTVKVMGRGILVMLCGTLGVMLGAPVVYYLLKHHLSPSAWKAFGTLAGSWIGGTGNMAAVSTALETSANDFGLAVLGDNAGYIVWLPVLLGSKKLAPWFHRHAKVSEKRLSMLERSHLLINQSTTQPSARQFIYLFAIGFLVIGLANLIAESGYLPTYGAVLTVNTWRILLLTTLALVLSGTPARHIACCQELGTALVYLFVANMGAKADLSGLQSQALWFVLASILWIGFHGIFIFASAWLFRVDIHSAAIASAANIGAVASAPIIAAHHNPRLVPVSVLMALLGYAMGTYCALATAWLCELISKL